GRELSLPEPWGSDIWRPPTYVGSRDPRSGGHCGSALILVVGDGLSYSTVQCFLTIARLKKPTCGKRCCSAATPWQRRCGRKPPRRLRRVPCRSRCRPERW